MRDPLKITYKFVFEDGTVKEFPLIINRETMEFISEKNPAPPAWAALQTNRCSNCSLDNHIPYCPVALNLSGIAEAFREYFAYQKASVSVATEDRTYTKETTIQEGLSALIGLVMATSGCPVLEFLKPAARFHLPFASLHETIFRMSSMYLMSQYFMKRDGRAINLEMDRIGEIYAEVGKVNRDFAHRLTEAAKKDANANALVNLDCIASMLPMAIDDTLEEIRPYFSAYFRE